MKAILSVAMLLTSSVIYGQNAPVAPVPKGFILDTNMLLLFIAVFLLLPIWILSNTFISSAKRFYKDSAKSGTTKFLVLTGFTLMSTSLFAQEASSPPPALGLLTNTMTLLLLCVIGAEILLLVFFAQRINDFMQKMESKEVAPAKDLDLRTRLKEKWAAMNFKPIEEEHTIDTGHSYDGIRELDNVIPPWFTTAFIITILFGIGYLYRYHIAKSAPTQVQEYKNEVALAEVQHDEYLKTQAKSVDESNVTILTGPDLDAGKKTFVTICAVCHKSDGGGLVGPNLTDDYWIHGGALKDIFKTIKYGYPEKGMISWKDQLSAIQIAQAANYVLTLRGTNPPGAKEKQGTLYVPEAAVKDTTTANAIRPDTLTKK